MRQEPPDTVSLSQCLTSTLRDLPTGNSSCRTSTAKLLIRRVIDPQEVKARQNDSRGSLNGKLRQTFEKTAPGTKVIGSLRGACGMILR